MRDPRRFFLGVLGILALIGSVVVSTVPAATAAGTARIVGGKSTAITAVPYQVWVVQISADQLSYASCGGSLINSEWVITAAHCVTTDTETVSTASNMLVFTGMSDIGFRNGIGSAAPYRSTVSEVVRHPSYTFDPSLGPVNDVALLHLSSPIVLGSTRQPIALPFDAARSTWPAKNASVLVSGWGLTSTFASDIPDKLQSTTISVLAGPNDTRCALWPTYDRIQNLCAGSTKNGKDICQGDSGGPYVATLNGVATLAGITSFNTGYCALAAYPAQAVRVTSFIDWFVPAPPQNLAWTWSGNVATVTWSASGTAPAEPLQGYSIQSSVDGGTTWSADGSVSASTTSYTATICPVGTACLYRVAGINAVNGSGLPLRFSTVPSAPQQVKVPASTYRSITVSWTVPARTFENPIRDYSVWWSSSPAGPLQLAVASTTATKATFARPAVGPVYVTVRARTTLGFPADTFGPAANPVYAR